MLLLELDGALFQLLAREPALLPSFQLPLSQLSLCGLRSLDPCAQHSAHFSQLDDCDLMLVI